MIVSALVASIGELPSVVVGEQPAFADTVSAPSASNITVQNNIGATDSVIVSNLTVGDSVYVYNSSTAGSQMGYAPVGQNGSATVDHLDLGTVAGSVYVSVKDSGGSESTRTPVAYPAESAQVTLSNNANLQGLAVTPGTLIFDPNTQAYSVNEPINMSSVVIIPTVADPTATLYYNGNTAKSGDPITVDLLNDSTAVLIEVKAQDGTTKPYTITFNKPSTGASLDPNGSVSGSLSPAGEIWYPITLTSDGDLEGTLMVDGPDDDKAQLVAELIDTNGSATSFGTSITHTGAVWGSTSGTFGFPYLRAGKYFIHIYPGQWDSVIRGFTLSTSFKPVIDSEGEPDDTVNQANTIAPNSSQDGHIGYYSGGYTDSADWYKITLPKDGALDVNVNVKGTLENNAVNLQLLDTDMKTSLKTTGTVWGPSSGTISHDYLRAGTYYLLVSNQGPGTTYTISNTFTPVSDNEIEPDNTADQANPLAPNSSLNGHIGYYSGGSTDSVDWYKVTLPKDGSLQINMNVLGTIENTQAGIQLFDIDKKTPLTINNTIWGGNTGSVSYDHLRAGTYYVCATNYGPGTTYTLNNTFIPVQSNEQEPNDSMETAMSINPSTAINGTLAYYSGGQSDNDDWYKVIFPTGGNFTITLTPKSNDGNTQIAYSFLNSDGTSVIQQQTYLWSNGSNYTMNNLQVQPGTYFIHINQMGGSGSIYQMNTSFTPTESTIPQAANITVNHNQPGTPSNVIVNGLMSGDVAKVYDSQTAGDLLGTSDPVSDASNTATVTIPPLDSLGGTLYVSVTSGNLPESARIPVSYSALSPSTTGSVTESVYISGGLDSVTIPSNRSTVSEYTAEVLDQNQQVLPNEPISWSLQTPVTGVSISPATGQVTVDSTATSSSFTLVATATNHPSVQTTKTVSLNTLSPSSNGTGGKQPGLIPAPTVNIVSTTDRVVTGTAQQGTMITVKIGDQVLSTTTVKPDGTYTASITPQAENTVLTITATDSQGNTSPATQVTVRKDECFIATAAFGSKFEPSVVTLRQFRDECLLTNKYGQLFVKYYYKNSPPVADFISNSECLKSVVRNLLLPLVGIAKAMLALK